MTIKDVKVTHDCDLPSPFAYAHGSIVECEECGQQWKAKHPGNPEYSGWSSPLIGRTFRAGRRRR